MGRTVAVNFTKLILKPITEVQHEHRVAITLTPELVPEVFILEEVESFRAGSVQLSQGKETVISVVSEVREKTDAEEIELTQNITEVRVDELDFD